MGANPIEVIVALKDKFKSSFLNGALHNLKLDSKSLIYIVAMHRRGIKVQFSLLKTYFLL